MGINVLYCFFKRFPALADAARSVKVSLVKNRAVKASPVKISPVKSPDTAAAVRCISSLNAPSFPVMKGRFTLVLKSTGYNGFNLTCFTFRRFFFLQESRHDVV